jgi:hypothetical protein
MPPMTVQGSRILGLLGTNANIAGLSKSEQTRISMQSITLSHITCPDSTTRFLTVAVQACVLLLGASRSEQEINRAYMI